MTPNLTTTTRTLTTAALLALAVTLSLAAPHVSAESAARSCCRADTQPDSSVSIEPLVIPDVTLMRMDGVRVTLKDELAGDAPVMLNFIFTTCTTICPVMSATFSQVASDARHGGEKIRLVSISIDPERDTPARLREYARGHEAGPDWHFLTGTTAAVETVQKAFRAYRGSKFNHAALTFLHRPGDATWTRIEGLRSAEEVTGQLHQLVAAR